MATTKTITKEELIKKFKITEVTDDGRIFCGEKEMTPYLIKGPVRKYTGKQREYHVLSKYFDGRVNQVLWHRAVWAWFNGQADSKMDIDHIDNNPFNNSISNLQELSREDNLAKRGGFKNQYQAMRPDVNWEERKERIENLKNEIKMANDHVKHLKELLKVCKKEWHEAEYGVRKILAHHNVKLCELDLEDAKRVWHELVDELNSIKGE